MSNKFLFERANFARCVNFIGNLVPAVYTGCGNKLFCHLSPDSRCSKICRTSSIVPVDGIIGSIYIHASLLGDAQAHTANALRV